MSKWKYRDDIYCREEHFRYFDGLGDRMKIKKISLKQDALASAAIFCYWISVLYYYTVGMSGQLFNFLRMFFSIPAFILVFFKRKTKHEESEFIKQLLLCFVLVIIGWLSSTSNHNLSYLAYGFMVLANVGTALFMYYYKINEKIAILLFLILSIILIRYYVIHRNFTAVFSISRNYVSVFLFCFLGLIFISCGKRKILLNILPIAVLLFSCMAGGRGGILTSIILNICCFGITMKYGENKEKIYYILGIIVAIMLFLVIFQFGDWVKTIRFFIGKFAYTGFGVDTDRVTYIYKPYIVACGHFENFLFGANMASVVDTHLHNSYLMTHARFGIIGFCIFVVLLIRAFTYSLKKGNKMFAVLILTLMVRAFTDTLFPVFAFDSIFFYILFIGLKSEGTLKLKK